jgi:hypothetical protein
MDDGRPSGGDNYHKPRVAELEGAACARKYERQTGSVTSFGLADVALKKRAWFLRDLLDGNLLRDATSSCPHL